jgi:hypothetical protein
MLSSHLRLGFTSGSLPFGPPNQNPVNTSPLPMRATCPAHTILLDLITLISTGTHVQIHKTSHSAMEIAQELLFEKMHNELYNNTVHYILLR